MRRVWLSKEDFGLFHQDITPLEFEFFRTHAGAFKRMWNEQTRRYWSLFVNAFEHFIWTYGIMKDFPMSMEESREYVDEIVFYIRDQFVDGRIATAKALIMDCAIVAQNRNCVAHLDKVAYAQNPFYMKETREVFRQLFGPPSDKKTYMKVLCGLLVYIKFAGAAITCLRRWLSAETVPSDENLETQFLDTVHRPTRVETVIVSRKEDLLKVTVGQREHQSNKSALSKAMKSKNSEKSSKSSSRDGEKKKLQELEKEEEEDGSKKKRKKRKKKELSEECASAAREDGSDVKGAGDREKVVVSGKEGRKCSSGDKSQRKARPGHTEFTVCDETKDGGRSMSTCSSPTDSGISSVSGAEPVAKELIDLDTSGGSEKAVAKEVDAKKRKKHMCACCGLAETIPKSFKRCQKCRGLPNPNYYCSQDCQAKHWKKHKLDHKQDTSTTTADT